MLKQTLSLNGFRSPAFLEGVTYSFAPDDYTPIRAMYIGTFNGASWDLSARPISN